MYRSSRGVPGAHVRRDNNTADYFQLQENQVNGFWRERLGAEDVGFHNWRSQAYTLQQAGRRSMRICSDPSHMRRAET